MNDSANSSPCQLTLKFTGVDDETTSDEEGEDDCQQKQQQQQQQQRTQFELKSSESALYPSNGNIHHLTVTSPIDHVNIHRNRNQLASISYKSYFDESDRRWTFIPNTDVIVVNVAVSREHHFRLNPFLYTIKLRHGEFTWTITKKYKDLVIFFERMNVFQKTAALPIPTNSHREIRRQMSHSQAIQGLTLKPDVLVDDHDINEREKIVAEKLQCIVNHPVLSTHTECVKFLESSPLSFMSELGRKYKEGIVKKNSGGYRHGCCANIGARIKWLKRWLIIKDTWIAYLNPKTGDVRAIIRLYLSCPTERKAIEFFEDVNRMVKTTGKDFHVDQRFGSFAPVRPNTQCQWLVDGSDYMEAVAYAIKSAQEEIYITDWFLSPEIYLKRPALSDEWRFDKMLEKKANEGVRIFVLLYKEVELAIGINSYYSKRKLITSHPENIKVLRYPDHTGQNAVLFWGHHEKLVIVDQSIALFGGIDLCYGRWDTYQHLLTDFGSAFPVKHNQSNKVVPRTHSVPLILPHEMSPVSIEALDLDDETYHRHLLKNDEKFTIQEPISISSQVKKKKMGHCCSEYHLKDQLKEAPMFDSVTEFIDNSNSFTTPKSNSRTVVNDNDATITEERMTPNPRRFSSSDIESPLTYRSHSQNQQLIEQQKKRRTYNINHTLFSNIYKRTNRASSTDFSIERDRQRAPSFQGSDINDEHPTSDRVYIRALEKTALTPLSTGASNHVPFLPTYSLPDGDRKFLNSSSRQRNQENIHNGDIQLENGHVDSNNRTKKISFLPNRRRASYFPTATTNLLSDEQKRKRDVIWPLKRSYSFDTPFHRETIEAMNKDRLDPLLIDHYSGSRWERLKLGIQSKINRFTKSSEDVSTIGLNSMNSEMALVKNENQQSTNNGILSNQDRSRFRDKIRRVTLNLKTNWLQRADGTESNANDLEKRNFNRRDSTPDEMSSFVNPSHKEKTHQLGLQGSSKLWFGKDYANFLLRDFRNLDQPFQDQIDRNTTPRMPWHDIGAFVYGAAARDLARHFIERWNFVKRQKMKDNPRYPFLLPKTYGVYTPCPKLLSKTFNCATQSLRSVGPWSAGINRVEESIHLAFIEMISKAKYYIYIENQFFVSLIDDSTVRNGIAEALFKRILRAHELKETFRVYIVMPLIPGFEGQYGSSKATALQAITHWNSRSISQGQQSLLARLAKEVGDPHRYICFFGLRTWSEMNGRLISEIVYVHSKLVIVDDNRVLIGSANINDRSLIGDRDSEISVLFEDTEFVRGSMNGKPVQVGRFASGLRKRLFREHLGDFDGSQINYQDPISDGFYKDIWLSTAARNTSLFEKIFNCIPTDVAFTFAQLREIESASKLSETNPDEARRLLQSVRGYLVLIPHKFLSKEHLEPRLPAKEILAPAWFWT